MVPTERTVVAQTGDSGSEGTKIYIYIVAVVLGLILIAMAYMYMAGGDKKSSSAITKGAGSSTTLTTNPSGVIVNDHYQPSSPARSQKVHTQEEFQRLAAQILSDSTTPAIVSVSETGL